ncbi:MAG TPA: TIGR01244 family sulfur transferase [Stellaceae bacterium]|jgi:sulfide:quinone oxidoreductase|nr:TIGR01244 family sulfur transferase [Stellaceae bacterium]
MAAELIPLSPGLSVTGRLERADIDALAQAGVRTIVNNRPDGEDPGQVPAAEARRLAEAHGIAYHHIPITAASLTRADVDAFAAALREAEAPVVAHCRSGTRSTLLWALTRMREGADPLGLIAEAARHGIDIASLPAVAARLRQRAG